MSRSMGKSTTWSKFSVCAFLHITYLYTFTYHHRSAECTCEMNIAEKGYSH